MTEKNKKICISVIILRKGKLAAKNPTILLSNIKE
jgi:hypothetical protein